MLRGLVRGVVTREQSGNISCCAEVVLETCTGGKKSRTKAEGEAGYTKEGSKPSGIEYQKQKRRRYTLTKGDSRSGPAFSADYCKNSYMGG